MIVNIRGTSGSGKSTIVRKLIDNFDHSKLWAHPDIPEQLAFGVTSFAAASPVPLLVHANDGGPDRDITFIKQGYKMVGYELHYPATERGNPSFNWKLRVVGRYETPCGGCDGINTQQEVEDRVRAWHYKGYNVIFEGLLISHIYTRWANLAKEVGIPRMLFAFLNTPLDTCLERVQSRRLARGVTEPLNPTNTIQKHKDSLRVIEKCRKDQLYAVAISPEDLYRQMVDPSFWGLE